MNIKLTETAVEQIKKNIVEQNFGDIYLRIGVKAGGCSGYSYILEFVKEVAVGDRVTEIDGIKILMDNKSALYMDGVVLDYKIDGLNGGFNFENPSSKHSCGCGKSFSV